MREGDLRKIREELLAKNPDLKLLPLPVLERLALAEHSWRGVQDLYPFDFGALILSFSKVAEEYLQSLLPPAERSRKVGLSELQELVRRKRAKEPYIREICDKFEGLLELRPPAAHPKRYNPGPDDLSRARHLTLEMLDLGALHAESQARHDAGRRSWDG
jgi:hypothetical protein